jgi:hypothetical protein
MSVFDWFIQIGLSVCGLLAIYFVNRTDKYQKYGSLFGIIGQPFWFIAMWRSEQWVPFFLSIVYTYSWGLGFYNHWIKKEAKMEEENGTPCESNEYDKEMIKDYLDENKRSKGTSHDWSGWPGAYCVNCGVEHALENATGMGWYNPNDDSFISPHHKEVIHLCDSNCAKKMSREDFEKVVEKTKEADERRKEWEEENGTP